MTKKNAIKCGEDVGWEIIAYGDFTEEEKEDDDAFRQAFYEIAENRKQYAGEVTEGFRRDAEWEGYEQGLEKALAKHLKDISHKQNKGE